MPTNNTGNNSGQGWEKTFGGTGDDPGGSAEPTSDGGYIIVGTKNNSGNEDVWLIKADANGNELWNKTFGGNGDQGGEDVHQTSDGGYIIIGEEKTLSENRDFLLIKVDLNGTEQWNKIFTNNGNQFPYSVQQTTDGGYILQGWGLSPQTNSDDIWLIKTDSDGNELWAKTFGGNDAEFGWSVQQTSDGGYIFSAERGESFSDSDIWLVKTDSDGNESWSKTFGESNIDEDAWFVQQTTDGGYIITGETDALGNANILLIKTDNNGNEQWNKTVGASGSFGSQIRQTSDGGYIIVGSIMNVWPDTDILLVKTDAGGNEQWSRTFGGSNYEDGYSVKPTIDGGYIISGTTASFGNGEQIYIIKTDANGNL